MPGTLIYDGDCGFCTASARWLVRRGDCRMQPWQGADLDALGLTEEQVCERVYWVDDYGRVTAGGAAAVAQALQTCGAGWRVAGRVLGSRPVRPVAEPAYRWVARHRHLLPGGTGACRTGGTPGRP